MLIMKKRREGENKNNIAIFQTKTSTVQKKEKIYGRTRRRRRMLIPWNYSILNVDRNHFNIPFIFPHWTWNGKNDKQIFKE